jgi:hypothetical protein
MNALTNPFTDSNDLNDPFANEVAANANADSGINLETHFPDGSPRPERLSEDTTYEEFLGWFEGSAMQGQMENYYSHRPETMNALSENSPGYERNEAGRYVNENGEELYYFTGPDYDNEKRNGAGLNADADYVTMDEIRKSYEEDTVLHKHFDSVDQYVSYIKDRQDLIDSGQIMDKWERSNQLWHDTFMRTRDGRGGPNAQYVADILEAERRRVEEAELAANTGLAEQYGIETNITDDNGNQLRWNGSGYSLIERYKEDDKWGRKLTMAAASYIISAGLAPALSGTLGAAGGKAAASAISNLATQYMQNGEIDWGSALMAAATAYGGQALSDSLAGSGVLGGIGDKITQFGDGIMAGGGDILSSAMQAGGMSLVTQLVMNGDIDWKDAAVAAAIAGGTTALQGFLSDIGKSGSETEVLEEIKVTAQHKGTLVGEDMYQLEDGTVIYAPADGNTSVLGNMSDLDLNGDGQITGNDLEEIQANNYEFKDPNPFENGEYVDYEGGGNAFREGGTYYVSEDGVVHQRGDVTYIDGGPNGTYLVKDAQGNEFYVKDAKFTAEGRFVDEDGNYVAVNGYYDGASGNVYDNIEDYTTANGITDNTANQTELTYGRNPNWNNDPNYRGTVYGGEGAYGVNGEMDVFYDPVTNTYYTSDDQGNAVEINVTELPEDIQNEIEQGNNPTGEDNSSADTGQDNQDTATGTPGGGTTNNPGGDGVAGSSGGQSTSGGNQDSTGEAGAGGSSGGGQAGYPDFSDMTPAEIAAWWAANSGTGNPGGGSTDTGNGGDSSGTGGSNQGSGTTTDNNAGAGGESGAGGGGNSTETEGGGGESATDGGGTGGGTGSGGGDGTGTGGDSANTGGGDDGANTGAGAGNGGGSGADGGTNGAEGGGANGNSGGGTDGVSGGTGDGSGGGGEGGGGTGGTGGEGRGMFGGAGSGAGQAQMYWSPIREQAMLPKYVQHRAALTAGLWNDLMK